MKSLESVSLDGRDIVLGPMAEVRAFEEFLHTRFEQVSVKLKTGKILTVECR